MRRRCQKWLPGLLLSLLGLLLVCPSVVMAAAAPLKQKDLTQRFGGVYRRPLGGNPSSLDPAHTRGDIAHTVMNQIFDGLVQFDALLNPIPAIAGFWEASVDGLTWTFYLRKQVKFHNGREVTADDFIYSFTRILDPAVQSPVVNLFKPIRGAEDFLAGKTSRVEGLHALDRYTLQITLKEPYTPLLSILAMPNAKVVPREEVEKLGDQFGLRPVGSGPFSFGSWESDRQIVLQAYDFYYEGRPFLDQIIFKIVKEDLASLSDFRNGELEESIVPNTKAGEIRDNPDFRSYIHRSKPTLHLLYIGFNTQTEPFTNQKVRQAFNYAINKEAIVREIIKSGSIMANGILPPGMPGYNPDLEGYYYNPHRAKQLLAEAGYPGGEGIPVIDLWHSSRQASTPRELEAYRKYLAEIGITVKVHKAPNWPAFKAMLTKGKAPMFRLAKRATIPDPDNFFFPLLFSQSKINRTFYRNPQVDQLLEQARRETHYLKRIELYRKIEKIAVQDAPWISQHHRVFEYLYQPYVRGIEINALGAYAIPMKKIWLHKLAGQRETKRRQ